MFDDIVKDISKYFPIYFLFCCSVISSFSDRIIALAFFVFAILTIVAINHKDEPK